MRTRTLITGAAFLIVGMAGAGKAHAQQSLRGSDTLDLVTTDVIAACTGATGNIVYTGGGSGAGQAAMSGASPTQHVAPMSRQLNGSQCTASARQLLVGLDGLSIVAKNPTHGDPSTCTDDIGGVASPLVMAGIPSQFVQCTSNANCTGAFGAAATCDTVRQFCQISGTLAGCTAAQGCAPDGTYTFDNGTASAADDWQDVVRQIYGGMNHTSAATLITDAAEVNADGTAVCFASAGGAARNCKRNPARIDCANPVRGVLLATYGSIIRSPVCTSGTPQECVKLKHAFRRDDLSGTTDAFQAIVGLHSLPPQTTLRSTITPASFAPEIADFASTVNPFCNAGTAVGNKGFSDGLDLDPYRRACSAGPAPDRLGLESVCQAFAAPTNSDPGCYGTGVTPANYPQKDRSAPQGRGILPGGSVDTLAALQADYLTNTATRPRCLGVVQPVSIPQDVVGSTVWTTNRYPAGGNCTAGVRSYVNILPARAALCPDGNIKAAGGLCRMPQNTTNGRFDCVTDSPLPAGAGISDARVFNLTPVNNAGNMATLIDSYQNPNPGLTGVAGIRRFARRYYGVNMVRPDSSATSATIATGCTADNDTQQIGCLVKANPCSIGFAGREAADAAAPFNNVGLRIVGIQATTANIENLATGGTPVYPLARKLWFNSFQDPLIGFAQPNLTDPELALSNCMGLGGSTGIIDTAIAAHNFVVVPAGTPRLVTNATGGGCPLP